MTSPVLQTFPLGFQWPTVDPFLFCVHHLDTYPEGDGEFGPKASLAGRDIGQDFAGIDGWRMYHGRHVPGFPQHPHRGFETLTYARQGLIDHSDSMGAAARFGRGDAQWMTAGRGVVHSEMFPLLDTEGPNTGELFQIWVNLPAEDKLVEPHFTMLWDGDIPRVTRTDDAGRTTTITVIAGALDGVTPPSPPPHSWASRPDADVAVWHLQLEPGATVELPAARSAETVRVLYVFDGSGLTIGGERVDGAHGAHVDSGAPVELEAAADAPVEVLVLQGRPIGEPVAQYGPFVMNTRAELQQAFEDYQRTQFGGWPWPQDDPVHGPEPRRFARHADGGVDQPEPVAADR
jgi:redox-sensitive bicupin YhaK (pirin superfamily)